MSEVVILRRKALWVVVLRYSWSPQSWRTPVCVARRHTPPLHPGGAQYSMPILKCKSAIRFLLLIAASLVFRCACFLPASGNDGWLLFFLSLFLSY